MELPVGEERETLLLEILPDDRISPQDYAARQCLHDDLENLLATLKPNQRAVLSLQFGLQGQGKLTAKQIATQLNLTHSKVLSAHKQAIKVLRRELDQIKDYLVC